MNIDTQNRRRLWFVFAVCAIGFAAAAVRTAAARGELWLDEIWTIQGVQAGVHSPTDIVLSVKHDNNHFLNSFFVYLIGPGRADWAYRCPALIAGTLAVFLAGWIQRLQGAVSCMSAMLLTGFSYLLVNYSSEARGYAYEILFAVALFGILCQLDQQVSVAWELMFTVVCMLGFLAHPLFLNVYLSAQIWMVLCLWRGRKSLGAKAIATTVALCTIIPGLFFTWLYFVNWGQMSIGGGESPAYFVVIAQTFSLVVGGPFSSPGYYCSAAITVLVLVAALWNVFGRMPRRAAFYLCAVVVFPAITLAIVPREDLYPRYFLANVLFLLLLWSDYLSDLWRGPTGSKWFVAAVLVVFLIANSCHVVELIINGRGHYREAIQLIEAETLSERAIVDVDHPVRQETMLDYYAERTPMPKPIEVFPISPTPSVTAEWVLIHDLDPSFVAPDTISEPNGANFQLVRKYPFAGLSGWGLYLYHRLAAAGG